MKLFLVRHAESELNKTTVHQYPHTKLSKTGLQQAERLARRLSGFRADMVICSKYTRAMQTAKIINSVLKKRIIYTKMLNELKHPTELEGSEQGSRLSVRISKEMLEHINDPDWHYSDEENLFDFNRRAKSFMKYLVRKNKEDIIVVTHGHFICMLLFIVLFGDRTDISEFYNFVRAVRIDNTGITECEFAEGRWRIMRLNDHAHLHG
jgi:broad specificity phosphatase PhoE